MTLRMRRIDSIRRILTEHKGELRRRFRVKEIGLFGSFLRKEQKGKSDLDILVEFLETPSLFQFIELEDYCSKLVGVKVDLVMKSALKPAIGEQILREVVYI
mgnify:CR=1 FL=1